MHSIVTPTNTPESYRAILHKSITFCPIERPGHTRKWILLRRFFTPPGVWSASDQTLEMDVWAPRNGLKRPRPIGLSLSHMPDHLSPRDKMSPIGLGRPTHQPIKWSSLDYLAMFTHLRPHTKIIEKGNLFDFATIFTRLTGRSCTGKRGNL